MRKPSCLISCSHWLPDGSLSVLVGRHGAMNPAGKVRCNMRKQIELGRGDCNFGVKPRFFCYDVLVMTPHTRCVVASLTRRRVAPRRGRGFSPERGGPALPPLFPWVVSERVEWSPSTVSL